MVRHPASKILGIGSISSSSPTGKRRWATELRAKVASGTRVRQFTQGETLLACVETILPHAYPTAGDGAVAADYGASATWIPCLGSNTNSTGTFLLKESSKTVTRIVRLHCLVIGPPDPNRTGA